MSVTCGFFNSINGDRKYDAEQMSSLFDGLIIDGVFASIGSALAVSAAEGLTVNVGTGKAWFNHTWTLNDSILPITLSAAEILLDRIDAVVLEVNTTESTRENSIKVVTGTPASSPAKPTLENANGVYQYALCYIYRKAGSTVISQSDITTAIGTSETPFVTAMLQTVSLDELLGKWQDELDQFTDSEKNDVDTWLTQMKSDLESEKAALDTWTENEKNDFLNWYAGVKDQMNQDAVTTDKIADNAVTSIKIASGAVTDEKIAGSLKSTAAIISIAASAWSNKTATVSLTDVTANNHIIVSPGESSRESYVECGVRCTAQAAGALTFKCDEVPSAALSVNVLCINL